MSKNGGGVVPNLALQKVAVEHSRLGIPLLFGADIWHGMRTIFPIPLGEAASWDPQLAERTARATAKEATASGLHWTYSPMVDVARDQRCGVVCVLPLCLCVCVCFVYRVSRVARCAFPFTFVSMLLKHSSVCY